jgi:hypothetical protein
MKKRLTFIFHRSGERGIALILTLGIITLVTLILIAFVVSMRVENTASKSFNDGVKARELALAAVDQAVATIRQATTRGGLMPGGGSGSILNYVTFPGAIYDFGGTLPATRIPLYSTNAVGAAASDTFDLNDAVNGTLWITGKGGEFPAAVASQFPVTWNYVATNGTVAPPSSLPLNAPIMGRFAYWVDDEASKINLNTAGTPPLTPSPDYGTSLSNEVDLSVLLAGLGTVPSVNAIEGIQTSPTYSGFATVDEVKLADSLDSDFTANRFSITAYSKDANYPGYQDDLDVLDRQRLVISSLGPGDVDGTGGGGITNAYFRLTDPHLGNVYSLSGAGATFDGKYGVNGLKQIIANVIAYQQPVNSPAPPDAGNSPPDYLGLAKTPYINEVQVRYDIVLSSDVVPVTNVIRTVSVELFYPYIDTDVYTPAPDSVQVTGLPAFGLIGPTATIAFPSTDTFGTTAGAQAYHFHADAQTNVLTVGFNPGAPTVAITYSRGGTRLDFSQVVMPTIATTLAKPGDRGWQGAEANDPCANEDSTIAGEWTTYTDTSTPPGTLGAVNTAYAPPSGDISKVVVRGGWMKSIGELGYIHLPHTAATANLWKHVTLQPGGGSAAGQIPDWALLDLFTTATPLPQTGGRININSFINPGLSNPRLNPTAPGRRQVPLLALLNSMSSVITPATLAQQIYDDDTSVRSDTYGMTDPTTGDPIFDTIGEVCEIPSLATGANQAAKEAAIRRLANIITVRSQEFTIWVMAQSIKQPSTSTIGRFNPTVDIITGEVRAQAVVERYENPVGTAPKIRVRYFRYLYN